MLPRLTAQKKSGAPTWPSGARLDDSAGQRALIDAGEPARSAIENLGPEACGKSFRPYVVQPEPGHLFEFEEVPAAVASRLRSDAPRLSSGQESVRRARRHVVGAPFGVPAKRQRGLPLHILQKAERLDAGSGAGLEFRRLFRDWNEDAARLLARQGLAARRASKAVSMRSSASMRVGGITTLPHSHDRRPLQPALEAGRFVTGLRARTGSAIRARIRPRSRRGSSAPHQPAG
jgi:hypothetical protein